jgi:hypothetical protein
MKLTTQATKGQSTNTVPDTGYRADISTYAELITNLFSWGNTPLARQEDTMSVPDPQCQCNLTQK